MAAFLVDGDLEKKFFQRKCPKTTVKKIGCNGRDVSLDEIAKRVATQIRTLGGKCFPIVIVIDRESRPEDTATISVTLLEKIKSEGITDHLIVAVADRMIENWILADYQNVLTYDGAKPLKKALQTFDGENGKATLKRIIPNYHETTIGVDLLCNSRTSIMSQSSNSFESFFNQLKSQLHGCHWLRN